jgi:hypothetical protein
MIDVVPSNDVIGICELRFVKTFSNPKTGRDALGSYLQGRNGRDARIEISIPNVLERMISNFNFTKYTEVAALLLSQIVFHEIGHHVHTFKRHGVVKNSREDFADRYTSACYYRYLSARKDKILAEYRRGSWNFLEMDKDGRNKARSSRHDIKAWLKENAEGVPFP